jgi:4-hydroxy-tetrahydrodipicolinate reductase
VEAGVHVVVGTTGFDLTELAGLEDAEGLGGANIFIAPNFAIGAVLMMKFAAEAIRYMARAEIIELHHDQKVDRPSGTAALTAQRMAQAAPEKGEPPVHSVRHDSIDRLSFMPGVILAVRRVAELPDRLTVGLEALL